MTFTATQYTTANASDMEANYAAIRARLMGPVKRPRLALVAPKCIAPPEAEIAASEAVKVRYWPMPTWMRQPVVFDEHVIAFRMAKRLLDMQARGEIEMVRFDRRSVLQIVSEVLKDFPGITISMLKSAGRRRGVVVARQTAIYEVRKQRPDLSYPMIGRWFGGRDHTTILHSVRKISALRGDVGPVI